MTRFTRLKDYVKKRVEEQQAPQAPWKDWNAAESSKLAEGVNEKIKATKAQPAKKWLKEQDDLGVWDEGDRQYSVQTPERLAGAELGRRLKSKGGDEAVKRAVKAESIDATKRDKTDAGGVGVSHTSLSREIRGELVGEHSKAAGLPKKVSSKLITEARKNTPGSEGAKLARQLMRVREQADLSDAALQHDYGRFAETYRESLRNAVLRRDERQITADEKQDILNNLDDIKEIGLEAVQHTYGRGVKGITKYEAPSQGTALLGTGERVARELFNDIDDLTPQDQRKLYAKWGSIIEEPLEDMGVIKEESTYLPPEDRTFKAQQLSIKRTPASLEFHDLISEGPNYRGGGTGVSFTKPHKWTKARQGGDKLIKTYDNELLKDLTEETAPALFEAINHIQGTAYRVNNRVLRMVQALDNQGKLTQQAPKQSDIDTSTTATQSMNRELDELRQEYRVGQRQMDRGERREFDKRKAEITQKYDVDANRVKSLEGKRIDEQRGVDIANSLQNQPRFYFKTQLDQRGRIYFTFPGLNPQASQVARGVLEYADGIVLDAKGVSNLKKMTASYIELPERIDIEGNVAAPARKIAKDEIKAREQWFDENEADLLRWGQDPVATYDQWAPIVDEKNRVQFLKGINEYYQWKQDPNYKSHLIAGMDASTSGTQIITALLDDHTMAGLVNVISGKAPGDTYIHVADNTKNVVQNLADGGDEMAMSIMANDGFWQNRRKAFKRPTMIYPYAAGADEIGRSMYADIADKNWALNPAQTNYLGKIITQNMEEIIPSMGVFRAIVKEMTKDMFSPAKIDEETGRVKTYTANSPTFTSDIGFPFKHDYPDYYMNPEDRIRMQHRGKEIALYPQYRQEDISPTRKSKAETALMANFIHFLDSQLLMGTSNGLKKADLPFTPVHDEFGTTLNGADEMLDIIRARFKTMFGGKNSDGKRILEELLGQNWDPERFRELIKRGELDIEETIGDARPFDFG